MMDDSFDELTVPDDWIDIINSQSQSQKRSAENTSDDEVSPAKLPKLSEAPENGEQELVNGVQLSSPDQLNHSHSKSERQEMLDRNLTCCHAKEIQKPDESKADDTVVGLPSITDSESISSSQETIALGSLPLAMGKDDASHEVTYSGKESSPCVSDEKMLDVASPSLKDSKNNIEKSPSVARDANNLKCVFPNVDKDKIYDMLIEDRSKENRLDVVSTKLLEMDTTNNAEVHSKAAAADGAEHNSIFKDVETVMSEIPSEDANEIYSILEALPPTADRAQKVISLRKKDKSNVVSLREKVTSNKGTSSGEEKPPLIKKQSTLIDDPVLKSDPLFHDMRAIAKLFPDKDRNEIYALLEANVAKANRIDIVVNELLSSDRHDKQPSITDASNANMQKKGQQVEDISEESLQEEVDRMIGLFPDADPNYIYEKLESMKDQTERCHILASEMFERKNYPKLQDRLERQKKEKPNKRDFTVEEFLEKFSDPQKTFGNVEQPVAELYRQNAFVVLKNEFRMLKTGYLRHVLAAHNNHLFPAYHEISADLATITLSSRRNYGRFLQRLRNITEQVSEPNEYFYHELWYTRNEQKVQDHIRQKEVDRLVKFTEAKERGELYECCCCYDDELLFEDLSSCPEGHLFCKVCVLRSTEAAFGEMKTKYPCLTGECDQHLPLNTLQRIVPANLFSKIVSRIQEEEVQQANIADLVACPFCPFATVMPNQEDKVLKCLNPQCLKESCRLCQEENHIPLKCSEVESKSGRSMRTFIENYIAEAVIRKCHKCGAKFVKDSGCNKMTCNCGASSCYACKEQDIDYQHFNANQRCANTDPEMIHQRDMEQAAIRAKNKYLADHPEAADVEMHSDFDQWVNTLSKKAQENVNNLSSLDEEEVEEDEESLSSYDEDNDDDIF